MAGNDPPFAGLSMRSPPDTVHSMTQPLHTPEPPKGPAWDITFTRLMRTVSPQIASCALHLAHRFQAIGLVSDTQIRHTPRGLSTLMAIVSQRGLSCIIDITLVDGMAVGLGPCASLDIRLLDACGEVVADGLLHGFQARSFDQTSASQVHIDEKLEQAATAAYVMALAHFDLLRPAIQQV